MDLFEFEFELCTCKWNRIFKISGMWSVHASKQAYKHTHAHAQWSHASVGLAQARPNYLVITCNYLCTTARSRRNSCSPVVSETAGNQRGLRGRGKLATTQSCKLVKLLHTRMRSVCIVYVSMETCNSCVSQQGVRVSPLLWVRLLGARTVSWLCRRIVFIV